MESRWTIVGLTISGRSIRVGPFEKRYAEQMLADIRNRVSNSQDGLLETEADDVAYREIDLPSLGMEPVL